MKKSYGLARAVVRALPSELRNMSTKQLLARLARLRSCEESLVGSDLTSQEVENCQGILFKQSPEWSEAYRDLKQELATREHVVSGRPKVP